MSEVETAIGVAAGAGGIKMAVAGVPAAAMSGAALITATGGAAAVALVGYGTYKWLSRDKKEKK